MKTAYCVIVETEDKPAPFAEDPRFDRQALGRFLARDASDRLTEAGIPSKVSVHFLVLEQAEGAK